jgi:hypothetical protein
VQYVNICARGLAKRRGSLFASILNPDCELENFVGSEHSNHVTFNLCAYKKEEHTNTHIHYTTHTYTSKEVVIMGSLMSTRAVKFGIARSAANTSIVVYDEDSLLCF